MTKKPGLYFLLACCTAICAESQTGAGIGIYPTGTETGIGFRSGKESRLALDARLARASLYSDKAKSSSFATELSLVYRIVKYERLRFHSGLGYKADWNFPASHKHGLIIPIGVEAFPFPFQNAGLFFEAAPFALLDMQHNYSGGLRTAAGFVFYFNKPFKENKQE